MKCFQLLFLLISIYTFSQNNSKIEIEDLKNQITKQNISIDSLGINTEHILNRNEQKTITILNNNEFIDFENQKIAFITGSAGRSIVNKQSFFISVKNSITRHSILSFSIIELDSKQKEKSGFDYIISFWVKTINPNSKKLLKELNKISHNY